MNGHALQMKWEGTKKRVRKLIIFYDASGAIYILNTL